MTQYNGEAMAKIARDAANLIETKGLARCTLFSRCRIPGRLLQLSPQEPKFPGHVCPRAGGS